MLINPDNKGNHNGGEIVHLNLIKIKSPHLLSHPLFSVTVWERGGEGGTGEDI